MSGSKRRGVRDYARLHWAWYRDEVLRAVAEEEPHALAVWPVLLAMAKEASDDAQNPGGIVSTSWRRLASECMCDAATIERIISLFQEGEMVAVENGLLGTKRITLVSFKKWQTPRYGTAERQQKSRDEKAASREKGVQCHAGVTPVSRPRHEVVTQKSLEERRGEKRREDHYYPPSPLSAFDAGQSRLRSGGVIRRVDEPFDEPFGEAPAATTPTTDGSEWDRIDAALGAVFDDVAVKSLHDQIFNRFRSRIKGEVWPIEVWTRATLVASREARKAETPVKMSEFIGWIVNRLADCREPGSEVDYAAKPRDERLGLEAEQRAAKTIDALAEASAALYEAETARNAQ